MKTGANGYDKEFSHDVIGILANLFTQGYFTDAHGLLDSARYVIGTQTQYDDGVWTYPWIWAIYLLKTGDLSFVKANFDTEGPSGSTEPSIKDTAHLIATDRTGPGGIRSCGVGFPVARTIRSACKRSPPFRMNCAPWPVGAMSSTSSSTR